MNVKIGAKIKALRKRDDVTQERLAEVLGVTSQAVSKWESESGYPDIDYITPIANFFNVTIDNLFNHNAEQKRRKIDEYCERSQPQRKQPQERIDMMRQALAEFPAEEKLLFILAEALYDKWQVAPKPIKMIDGCYVYDDEKYKSSDGRTECTAIFEELLASSVDDSIRAKCRWYLAMIYGRIGEKEKVMKIAGTCDTVSKSRQMLLAHAAQESKEREVYQKEAILALLDSLEFILGNFATSRANHAHGDDLEDYIRSATPDIIINIYIKINKFIFNGLDFDGHDGNRRYINRHIMYLYCSYALSLIQRGKIDEAYEKLDNAYKHAKNCDDRFSEKGEHLIKADSDDFEIRLLPLLLYELKSEHQIGIPTDPKLCDDPRYTALICKIEADIAKAGS